MAEILYNKIGEGYNTTRAADKYIVGRLSHLLSASKGKRYLDIGCGTGNYTIALTGLGLDMSGVEPSERMLEIAKERNSKIKWTVGSAENIPFENDFFDGAVGTLTLHHWTDFDIAFKELNRVSKEKAQLVFFTSTPEQMKGYWLNYYFPKMMENSIIQMPSLEKINKAFENAGLKLTDTEKYFVQDDLQDYFLYVGKNKPEMYFNEIIRKGISSFANIANFNEVKEGLAKLSADMESGKFAEVKKHYENETGDYLFVVGEK